MQIDLQRIPCSKICTYRHAKQNYCIHLAGQCASIVSTECYVLANRLTYELAFLVNHGEMMDKVARKNNNLNANLKILLFELTN